MDSVSATDSYLAMLLQLPHLSGMTVLCVLSLTMMRIIPIVALAPFFGARNLPAQVRMMFSLAIVAIILPQNLLHVQGDLDFDVAFLGYAFKELLLGSLMGFLSIIPFYMAQTSGNLIDHMRGSASLQVTDPATQTQTSPLGILYNYVTIVIFFFIGGPFLFLNALVYSYVVIPVDRYFNSAFFTASFPIWQIVVGLFGSLMTVAIQLAAPPIVGILMAEMFLGIANRLAPQVQIVFLGIPLKSWLGIFLLLLAWALILQQLSKESLQWLKTLEQSLQAMQRFLGERGGR